MQSPGRNFFLIAAAAVVIYWLWPSHRESTKIAPPTEEKPASVAATVAEEPTAPLPEKVAPSNTQSRPTSTVTHEPSAPVKPVPTQPARSGFRYSPEGLSKYGGREFRRRFKGRDLDQWLKESHSFSNRPNSVMPNYVFHYLFRSDQGVEYRYRQAMAAQSSGFNLDSCVSLLLPDSPDPVVGIYGEDSLELREADTKWVYIAIVQKRHYFLIFLDTTPENDGMGSTNVLFYYQKQSDGTYKYIAESVGKDPNFQGVGYARSHNSIDYCGNTY